MNEENADMKPAEQAPEALVRTKRSFSIIWVVPIIALLIGVADENGSYRRPEGLGKTDAHRIGRRGQSSQAQAGGDMGIPEPGTIEMNPEPDFVGLAREHLRRLRGEHAAAGAIVGVLQAEQACDWIVHVIRLDGRLHLLLGKGLNLSDRFPRGRVLADVRKIAGLRRGRDHDHQRPGHL